MFIIFLIKWIYETEDLEVNIELSLHRYLPYSLFCFKCLFVIGKCDILIKAFPIKLSLQLNSAISYQNLYIYKDLYLYLPANPCHNSYIYTRTLIEYKYIWITNHFVHSSFCPDVVNTHW